MSDIWGTPAGLKSGGQNSPTHLKWGGGRGSSTWKQFSTLCQRTRAWFNALPSKVFLCFVTILMARKQKGQEQLWPCTNFLIKLNCKEEEGKKKKKLIRSFLIVTTLFWNWVSFHSERKKQKVQRVGHQHWQWKRWKSPWALWWHSPSLPSQAGTTCHDLPRPGTYGLLWNQYWPIF